MHLPVLSDLKMPVAGALLITKKQETPQGRLTFYVSTVTIPDGDAKGLTFHCHSTIAYEQV